MVQKEVDGLECKCQKSASILGSQQEICMDDKSDLNRADEVPLHEVVYRRSVTVEKCDAELLKATANERQKGSSAFLYITAFTVNLIALTSGIAFGWTSPVNPRLNGKVDPDQNPLSRPTTPSEESWITGLLCLGCIVGPLVAGRTADKIGRKRTLLVLAIPMVISFLMTSFARTVPLFYLARLFLGFSVGSVFAVLPMYLGEIAEDHNRGTIGCLMGVCVATGLLYSYVIGPFLSVQYFSLVCLVPLAIFIPVFFLFSPESPVFLATIQDDQGVVASLRKLRGRSDVELEAISLLKNAKGSDGKDGGGVLDVFRNKASRKGFIICVGLVVLQQFAGINAVLSYMQSIFDATGSSMSPEISTIIVGIVQVITTLITSYIVEKLGRRLLFLFSSLGSCVSLVALGVYFHLKSNAFDVESLSWLPVLSLIVYIIAFNIGFGPLPWAVLGELFAPDVKSTASTLVTLICFVAAFLITLFFPALAAFLGMAQSFWVFSVFCFMAFIFVYTMLPETKGRTLREIQSLLEGIAI